MTKNRWSRVLASAGAVTLVAVAALAQGPGFRLRPEQFRTLPNFPYDGRFTFVRVNYFFC